LAFRSVRTSSRLVAEIVPAGRTRRFISVPPSCVPARGLDLKDALAELHDRDIECPTAEIDDGDAQLLAEAVEAVGQGGSGRFVDQADDLQPGDLAGVLGGAALVVVEVRRDGDDRLLDGSRRPRRRV
jgi:hypothetical protein